jgi:L-amino acid N-acyltransferase YncA
MHFSLGPVSREDGKDIIEIFNHYIEHSFAAYPESKVPDQFFDIFLDISQRYPFLVAKDSRGKVLGFGMLRPHNQIPTFSMAAELTCFISPEYTSKGIGSQILYCLMKEAKERGITTILASISSLNAQSLAFHGKNGFVECGRFRQVGKKKGQEFDEIWMQKMI